jgi:hypothetical protein
MVGMGILQIILVIKIVHWQIIDLLIQQQICVLTHVLLIHHLILMEIYLQEGV